MAGSSCCSTPVILALPQAMVRSWGQNADLLRLTMSASNVTVLTSSTSHETSGEDEKWNHGAFTKVLLDALGKDADVKHDGFIWMTQLTHYVVTHVSDLTGGQQHPGVEQRFEGPVFIAGQ